MGSYPSCYRSRPQSPALRGGDQLERPECLGPLHPARRVASPFRVYSVPRALSLARRLSYEDPVTSASRRQHCRRLVVVRRQRFPIEQARCLFLGVFSSATWSGYQKKVGLSICSSRMPCASLILNLASVKGKVTLRLALEQSVLTIWSSLTRHFLIPHAKKISAIKALEESSEGKVKEGEELTTLGDSREGLAKQEEDQTVSEKTRDSDGSGTAQSAFRRLMVNGVPSSFMPKPGPLKTDFCYKSSGKHLISKSQTSFINSCSKRNPITSSYSSTRDFPMLQKRDGAGTAGLPHPALPCFKEPAKEASEKGCEASTSVSVVPQRKIKDEEVTHAPSGQQQNLGNELPPSDPHRPRKRKIPLLMPYRINEPLILPPSPQLGYEVTAEDLNLEKRAMIQWINNFLKDD